MIYKRAYNINLNRVLYTFFDRVSEFNKSNVKVLKIDDLINTIINDLKSDNSMILTYEEMDQMYIKLDNIDINEIELKKE